MSENSQIKNKLYYDDNDEKYKIVISPTSTLPEVIKPVWVDILKRIISRYKKVLAKGIVFAFLVFVLFWVFKEFITPFSKTTEPIPQNEVSEEEKIKTEFLLQIDSYLSKNITLNDFKNYYSGKSIRLVFDNNEFGEVHELDDVMPILNRIEKEGKTPVVHLG